MYKKKVLPKDNIDSGVRYDFLQYIRVIFKWACAHYEITRPHLELMLGLYPIGMFTKNKFSILCRNIDMNPSRLMNNLIDIGLIEIWRPGTKKQAGLYRLSSKSKEMCDKVHRICVGEIQIPKSNVLSKSSRSIDKRYMDVIKTMNKKNP